MNYVTNGLTGRTKQTLSRQLNALYLQAHENQDEVLANKLHTLYEDSLWDNYITVKQIKNRYHRISAS